MLVTFIASLFQTATASGIIHEHPDSGCSCIMPDAVAVWKRLAMNVTSMSTPCQALLASGEVERAIAGKKQSLVLGKEPEKVFAVLFGEGQPRSAAGAKAKKQAAASGTPYGSLQAGHAAPVWWMYSTNASSARV